MSSTGSLTGSAPTEVPSSPAPAPTPGSRASNRAAAVAGTTLGRYVVLEKLGAGAMGTVYAAYDPELDRRIAVKLVRLRGSEQRRGRMVREAQAMARLSHENVVAVHDVGTVGQDVFIAMELVAGESLARYLARGAERRTRWRDVVSLFTAAGRGLAAAHAAGIVHRDFKPENVMVAIDRRGKPRRVLVTDFGVARALGPDAEPSVPDAGAERVSTISMDALSRSLTATGARIGTPAYMAPEQLIDNHADERSDQFAFCIALHEGLYGQRPFGGESVSALAFATSTGRIRPAPRGSRVPGWLRSIVLRGLSSAPQDRYPSMNMLLADLGRDRGRRLRYAAVAVPLLGAALWGVVGDPDADRCRGGEGRVAAVWGERRAEVAAAFEAVDRPFAAAALAGVEGALDHYASGWAEAYNATCAATHIDGEQSAELLDLRMRCLSRQREALGAVVRVLAEADSGVVARAASVAAGLPDVEQCLDLQPTDRPRPVRTDKVRAQVEVIESALALAAAQRNAGRYHDSVATADWALHDARSLGDPVLLTEAQYELGVAQSFAEALTEAETNLTAAHHGALETGDDTVAARAATELVRVVGGSLSRTTDAELWIRHAEAAIERLGRDPETDANLANAIGIAHEVAGKYAQAIEAYERALDQRERDYGDNDIGVASVLTNLALVYEIQGKYARAIEYHQRALEIRERAGGPTHPEVAESHNNLGLALRSSGERSAALEHFRTAVKIAEHAQGPDALTIASALNNMGAVLEIDHRFDEAGEAYQRALSIRRKALPGDHPLTASVLKNLGINASRGGEDEVARDYLEQAGRMLEATLGPDHAYVGEVEYRLGELGCDRGDYEPAGRHLERALDIFERAFPEGHAFVGVVLRDLGRVAQGQGNLALARERFAAARTMLEKILGSNHPDVATTESRQGKLEVEAGNLARAKQHYEAALAIRTEVFGADHSLVGHSLTRLGEVAAMSGRHEDALIRLETALEIVSAERMPAARRARTEYSLARVLWRDPSQRSRARELARHARQRYAGIGPSAKREVEEIDTWLSRPSGFPKKL